MLGEALLSKIFNSIVISISHKILNSQSLSMSFKPVHETRSIPFHLVFGWYSKENDFHESLSVKGPEHAATNDWGPWWVHSIFINIVFTTNYHGLVLPIHNQTHDVVSGHSRKLLCHDVLKINQISHRFECFIILYYNKLNFPLIFLYFNLGISL